MRTERDCPSFAWSVQRKGKRETNERKKGGKRKSRRYNVLTTLNRFERKKKRLKKKRGKKKRKRK